MIYYMVSIDILYDNDSSTQNTSHKSVRRPKGLCCGDIVTDSSVNDPGSTVVL